MRMRINSEEYLDKLYSTDWRAGYGGALKRFEKVIGLLDSHQRVLDIGCAGGDFLKMYHDKYPESECFGMDISEVVVKQAEKHFDKGAFFVGSVYDMHFTDMDLVHCGEVLEHLEDPQLAIVKMRDCLKPGGLLVLTTINENAAGYEEHLWKWDLDGVIEMLSGFKVVQAEDPFSENTMLIIAKKI